MFSPTAKHEERFYNLCESMIKLALGLLFLTNGIKGPFRSMQPLQNLLGYEPRRECVCVFVRKRTGIRLLV